MDWHYTKKGKHTVRSAYYQILNHPHFCLDGSEIDMSPLGVCDHVWSNLWRMKLPQRVLLFARRLCSNSLPTPDNLRIRHLDPDDTCSLSGIWQARNLAVFEQMKTSTCSTVLQASRVVHDFVLSQVHPERNETTLSALPQGIRRAERAVHVSFDGVVSLSRQCAGAGVYIVSPEGRFFHGVARHFPNVWDSDLAELLALPEALLLCRRVGLSDVNVLGDS
ncbi:OLC1v1030961C1 [Oldenlandia corymbosa var. corymbosa]|uniref:OLC1v1030961C1 n=1 Tax=Oldenlandia corymbosa var. corymbosa TaxID=529605 RepID=A0AAV1CJF0_OLDCO|nr:OLC1v1030961C1 [Oldenlandia corymbosa var. corymbosa]